VACRLCFKQVAKLEQSLSREGSNVKEPEIQLGLVRKMIQKVVSSMIQKVVEQRDEQLALLDKEHDSAKKQVHTSAPINNVLTCVTFVLVVLFGSLLFGFCFSIQVKGAKTCVWFPGGVPEFLKDPTACRLDLNAVKGFAIDEP
jgi:preprotein translocase subunit SecG